MASLVVSGEEVVVPCGVASGCSVPVLFVATVDNAAYDCRLQKTIAHLRERGAVDIVPVFLLDAEKVPLKKNKVLMAGWRENLLPQIEDLLISDFAIVLEDDARLAKGCSVATLADSARAAFEALPHVDLLSLGHCWHRMATETQSLSMPLSETKHAHASTAICLRRSGLGTIRQTFQKSGLAHLDEFLFRLSGMPIAMRDPPLVGWASESVTLTNALAHGQALQGGGRRSSMPPAHHSQPHSLWVLRNSTAPNHLLRRNNLLLLRRPGHHHHHSTTVEQTTTTHQKNLINFPGLTADTLLMAQSLFRDDDDDTAKDQSPEDSS